MGAAAHACLAGALASGGVGVACTGVGLRGLTVQNCASTPRQFCWDDLLCLLNNRQHEPSRQVWHPLRDAFADAHPAPCAPAPQVFTNVGGGSAMNNLAVLGSGIALAAHGVLAAGGQLPLGEGSGSGEEARQQLKEELAGLLGFLAEK